MNKNSIWITAYDGTPFYLFNPPVDSIKIENLAHGASMICRFSGQIKRYYSVAEHCYHVSYLCNKKHALAGLVHDLAEGGGFGDLASPIKHSAYFKNFNKAEKYLQGLIFQKYCGYADEPLNVKVADSALVMWEAEKLLIKPPEHLISNNKLGIKLYCWTPKVAKAKFLARFKELTEKAS